MFRKQFHSTKQYMFIQSIKTGQLHLKNKNKQTRELVQFKVSQNINYNIVYTRTQIE